MTDEAATTKPLIKCLTIDGPHTRDIDDGVWVKRLDDGAWRVTVAISDVSGTVADGSPEDEKARAMVETKYFATGNSPMLPRTLSDYGLSLWPHKRRSVIAVRVTLDESLDVVETWLELGEVKSLARLAYADVPRIVGDENADFHKVVIGAAALARGLLDKRRAAGAMALYDLNNGWITTEEGFLRKLEDCRETIGQVIVQEFMILANSEVAKWAIARDVPILFRNHTARLATPDRTELMRQLDEATKAPMAGLDALRQRVHMLLDRARYGADVRGHYGLNLPAYTHFTSPIRRYADLVTHRQVRAALLGQPLPYTREHVAALGDHIANVLDAERTETSRAMKEAADDRAVATVARAVDPRRLDGLMHKEFERVVKVEARSGRDPSPVFAEAFVRRANEDRLSLLAMTVVVTQAPLSLPTWKPIAGAVVAALSRRPTDAVSVLAQATQVSGWPEASFEVAECGEPHARTFTARASVRFHDFHDDVRAFVSAEASGRQKKQAEQVAAVRLVATLCGCDAQVVEVSEAPAAQAKPVVKPEASKDPVSAINEWTQKTGAPAPTYEFSMSGPSHVPVVTCVAKVGSVAAEGTGSSKQEAKKLAARDLLKLLIESAR